MPADQLPRMLDLAGVPNARELGGYPVQGGGRVRPGLLLRSGALSAATPEDRLTLTGPLRLGYLVDLRTLAESAARPDPEFSGVRYYHLLVLDEDSPAFSDVADPVTVHQSLDPSRVLLDIVRKGRFDPDIYAEMLLSPWGLEAYRAFFKVLLKNDGYHSVLFHCSAGKDRTGIAAALLLAALGAGRDVILADYEATNRCLADKIGRAETAARASGANEEELRKVRAIAGVDPDYLIRMFAALEARYGGMEAFLAQGLGLDDGALSRLRGLYLCEA